MANQNLSDLNGYLFEQLDRLNQENLTQVELDKEVKRARAVNDTARNIVENAKTVLEASKVYEIQDRMNAEAVKPKMLE
ncbi:hypothetical protein [Vagococcus fluvialis]|uniref:hypothetical protein n=1 Tax=Vagococcus fluvialis TaxID=2738 RepID=UPI001D09BD78|nr:hypothetical protein [Vagococcus fluvialis]UDM78907.1 hypothetical protein K5K97_09290 [Vagococcus fluvialis]UDM79567.1 hypothetical protein K5K97_12865 [Vagococcus fluvialis]